MAWRIFRKSFWVKAFVYMATIGLIISGIAFYKGLEGYKTVYPVENYVDDGVHEFRPIRVIRVSNGDNTYDPNYKIRMREAARAKWYVVYKAIDKSGYSFRKSFGRSESSANQAKKEGNVKRRVLVARDEKGKRHIYVTQESDTISSYVDSQVSYYSKLLTIPLVYLPLYLLLLGWYFRIYRRKLMENQNP